MNLTAGSCGREKANNETSAHVEAYSKCIIHRGLKRPNVYRYLIISNTVFLHRNVMVWCFYIIKHFMEQQFANNLKCLDFVCIVIIVILSAYSFCNLYFQKSLSSSIWCLLKLQLVLQPEINNLFLHYIRSYLTSRFSNLSINNWYLFFKQEKQQNTRVTD